MNGWSEVWKEKSGDLNLSGLSEFESFCLLKKVNGFDVAVADPTQYYRSFYEEWLGFYEQVLEITNGSVTSVYEVGCGSGVNLYMFRNRLNCIVGGEDYSQKLVDCAREVVGAESELVCREAALLSALPKYDLVMSESVFQYFDSTEYAETVLRKMIEKSRKITYLGEIHDAECEQELIAYRRKTIKDYDERYKGLSKCFYRREWIEGISNEYGKKVLYTPVRNPEYLNAKYLFNCYIF